MKSTQLLLPALALSALALAGGGAGTAGSGLDITLPFSFQAGQPARAAEVNANFAAVESAVEVFAGSVDARIDVLEQSVGSGSSVGNVVTVGTEGADFTSVAVALASILDASAANPYLVMVGPGVFLESQATVVPAFVTLRGSGSTSTVIRSTRSAPTASSTAARTLELEDGAAVEDLAVENLATSQVAVAVGGSGLGRGTVVRDVVARATGGGGTEHHAVFVTDSDLTVVGSTLEAAGATSRNAAFSSDDTGGAFAQPLVKDCVLDAAGTVTGVGVFLTGTALHMDGCRIDGDFRAVLAQVGGITTIRGSRVATLGLSPVYEQTGNATIRSGNVYFVGGDPVGLASQFKYTWCIKPNFDPVENGFGSDL